MVAPVERPAPISQKMLNFVILMHGFMANMTLEPLKSLTKELERRGIASLRFDFDGHGRSYGKFSEMTPSEAR